MKPNRLHLAALAVVAVLAVAGCGDDDEGDSASTTPAAPATTGTTTQTTPSEGAKAQDLKISADPGGQLKFDKSSLTAEAGEVKITMDNPSSVPHAVGVKGSGVDEDGETVQQGGVSTVSANLKAGEYEFYCPVPGHEEAGMKGTLTVK
jgi:plastocyanin